MNQKLLSIRQMAELSGLSRPYFTCGKSNGSLKLDWVKLDHAVFATEESFLQWLKQRRDKAGIAAAKATAAIENVERGQ